MFFDAETGACAACPTSDVILQAACPINETTQTSLRASQCTLEATVVPGCSNFPASPTYQHPELRDRVYNDSISVMGHWGMKSAHCASLLGVLHCH